MAKIEQLRADYVYKVSLRCLPLADKSVTTLDTLLTVNLDKLKPESIAKVALAQRQAATDVLKGTGIFTQRRQVNAKHEHGLLLQ